MAGHADAVLRLLLLAQEQARMLVSVLNRDFQNTRDP